MSFSTLLKTLQPIVNEIEAEQVLVAANRELIHRMEAKVKAAIDRVWGGGNSDKNVAIFSNFLPSINQKNYHYGNFLLRFRVQSRFVIERKWIANRRWAAV